VLNKVVNFYESGGRIDTLKLDATVVIDGFVYHVFMDLGQTDINAMVEDDDLAGSFMEDLINLACGDADKMRSAESTCAETPQEEG
jgi:hypothetical protein